MQVVLVGHPKSNNGQDMSDQYHVQSVIHTRALYSNHMMSSECHHITLPR